jgi:hypothetical protein
MYEYRLGDLAQMLTAAIAANRDLIAAGDMGAEKPNPDYCEKLAVCVDGLAICCENFDADSSLIQQMRTLERELKDGTADTRCPVLRSRLQGIIEGIQNNLDSRKFFYVPKEDATYWHNLELFGKDVPTIFPIHAAFEIAELGSCFAASRPTACIFHSMRIAEYGLRILAKRVHVKLTDKGKPVPIEYGTWDKVIQGIRNKIADVRKKSIGPKKEKALQFYSAAADQCEYMKDIWRNEIAHARHRFYTRDEVLGVIGRVHLFARLVAEHEIPKDGKKHLAKINQRIRELQQGYEGLNERSPQRDQSSIGSGESGETKEKAEG